MVYGTQITIVTGAFVNQQTSLGGLTLLLGVTNGKSTRASLQADVYHFSAATKRRPWRVAYDLLKEDRGVNGLSQQGGYKPL